MSEDEKHFMVCSAPICMCNCSKKDSSKPVWYPGEKICNLKPSTLVQKRQLSINNLLGIGRLKYIERTYTEEYLKNSAI